MNFVFFKGNSVTNSLCFENQFARKRKKIEKTKNRHNCLECENLKRYSWFSTIHIFWISPNLAKETLDEHHWMELHHKRILLCSEDGGSSNGVTGICLLVRTSQEDHSSSSSISSSSVAVVAGAAAAGFFSFGFVCRKENIISWSPFEPNPKKNPPRRRRRRRISSCKVENLKRKKMNSRQS